MRARGRTRGYNGPCTELSVFFLTIHNYLAWKGRGLCIFFFRWLTAHPAPAMRVRRRLSVENVSRLRSYSPEPTRGFVFALENFAEAGLKIVVS